MQYIPTIGIEVHAQLATKSKLFCGCSTDSFGAPPNSFTCPVCLGLPGVLPVVNRKAVEFVIKTAAAFGCGIPGASRFARKNYFYPDLPKAYQITQYELPIGINGRLDIIVNGRKKTIRIHRIHLEEDTGKLVHFEGNLSGVDYNRTGTPLMEIVSEADVADSEEAVAYLMKLRSILRYLGVCEANMERGDLRCEPNISIRPADTETWGTKTELKNLNSFRAVSRGIEYEIERQRETLESGGRIVQETRRWDEATQTTQTMRSKEYAHDYRYFPDPDLPPVECGAEQLERLRGEIPELPDARRLRFVDTLGLPEYDADVLTAARELADYYEAVLADFADAKTVSNWVQTEVLGALNEAGRDIADCPIPPGALAALLNMVDSNEISGRTAKDVFKEMFATGKPPADIVREKGLTQVSDTSELEAVVDRVIAENPGPADEFRGGKDKALGFLVGRAMRLSGGRANPKIINELFFKKLR